MNATLLLSFRDRAARRWTDLNNSLRDIRGRIVAATGRAVQRAFDRRGSLVPIPVKVVARPRRLDQDRSRD